MSTCDITGLIAGLLQFAVAGYALRLNRLLGPRRVGWSLFTAFALLALLHLIQSVARFDAREQSTITIEVVYSLISLLLLTGMAHVQGLLKERIRFEQEERRLRAELEIEVQKKTLYLTKAMQGLQTEIDERKRMEAELQSHIELLKLVGASRRGGWSQFTNSEPATAAAQTSNQPEVNA